MGGETLELERFKETLLEFLSDVTTISKTSKDIVLGKPGCNKFFGAPKGYGVLSPYLLVKIETSSKVSDRPKPEREEDSPEFKEEKPKEEIYHCIVKFKFYTDEWIYYISSTWLDYHAQYLGCIVNRRLQRPGEDWTRGCDLPDGYFCRETWERIKNAIIRNEMEGLSKYIINGRYGELDPKARVETTIEI